MADQQKKELQSAGKSKEGQITRASRALSPFDEMDRLFENFLGRAALRPFRSEWPSWGELAAPLEGRVPKVDVIDRDDQIVVRAEVPGIKREDLDVSVSDNTVTIKGETRHEEKEEKGDFYRHEISRGAFARTVALPHTVSTEDVKARFKDGVLELTLPKVEKAKRRNITID